MTFDEWADKIMAELDAAGFEAHKHEGFPLVPMPRTHAETVRFLDHKFSMAVDRSIYSDGCLITPVEFRGDLDKLK